MKKTVAIKLVFPLFVLVLSAVLVSAYLVSNSISEQIHSDTDKLVETQLQSIIKEINLSENLVLQQVNQGVNILIDKINQKGEPKIGSEIVVNGKTANDLIFGSYRTANDFTVVDDVKKIVGGTATIFSRKGTEFIRISTNVQKDDGSRAIGTILNPDGRAYKSIIKGDSYFGLVNILGKPYLTAYVPIFDKVKNIIGIYYAGYTLQSLSEIGKMIESSTILENGFIALKNEKDEIIFHSDNTNDDIVDEVLSTNKNKWIVKEDRFEPWNYLVSAAYPAEDVENIVQSKRSVILYGGMLVLIFMLVMLYPMIRIVVITPLKKLESSTRQFSEGDLETKVDVYTNDEFGLLGNSFRSMIESIKNSMIEVEKKSSEAQEAAERAREAESKAMAQQKYLEEKTVEILKEMKKFAHGDLTVKVKESGSGDDIDQLFRGFNESVGNISKMMVEVSKVANLTAASGNEISSSTEEIAAGSQEQSTQISEVAGAVEQITRTLIDTSRNISEASRLAKDAGDQASDGEKVIGGTVKLITEIAEVVKNAADNVQELGESTRQISEIIQVINEIADQTNLLALNAAIEAARAGEEGRGFAVVADEVRKLAERTSRATKEIESMISGIQSKTDVVISSIINGTRKAESGKSSAGEAGKALTAIVNSSKKVDDMILQIASASEEQSSSIEEISKSIEMINSVAQQSADGINMIAQSAEGLYRLTSDLQGMIDRFKVTTIDEDNSKWLN